MKSPSTVYLNPQRSSQSTRPAGALRPLRIALAMACMGCAPLGMAQGLIKLPDPYEEFRNVNNGTWSVGEYGRAKNFNLALIHAYSKEGESLSDTIENTEKFRNKVRQLINIVDFGISFKDFHNMAGERAVLLDKIKNTTANAPSSSVMAAYIDRLGIGYKDVARKELDIAFAGAIWLMKKSVDNGVIDDGAGDLYDLFMSDASSGEKKEQDFITYITKDYGSLVTALTKVFVEHGGDGLLMAAARQISPSYIYVNASKIVLDVVAAAYLASSINANNQKRVALEFLKYYMIGFKGDKSRFEKALGQPDGVNWNLREAFWSFQSAHDHNGVQIANKFEMMRMATTNVVDEVKFDNALEHLKNYIQRDGNLSIKYDATPGKRANPGSRSELDGGMLSLGDEIQIVGTVDPYLAQDNCALQSGLDTRLQGLLATSPGAVVSNENIVNAVRVTGTLPFLKQDIQIKCGSASYLLTASFAPDELIVPAGYFNWSEPVTLQGDTPTIQGSFRVSFQPPALWSLVRGSNGELVSASTLRVKFWIKEKVQNAGAPSDWALLTEKEILGYLQNPTDRITVSAGTTTLQGADYQSFFIDRTGQRVFKFGATVYGTPYLNQGTGYAIELSKDAVVRAADLQFGWQYDPYHLIVADPAAAGYDAGWFSATAGLPFTFCFGQPYDGARGPLQSYRLWLTPDNGGSLGSMVSATATPYDAATGCGVFSVAASGRYKINGIEALINPAQDPQGEGRIWFGNIPPEYVQVAGADQPGTPGGGTPGGGDPGTPGTHPLNDTGITWSGHATSGNAATCDASHPAGQDCRYGRDAQAAAGQLTKTGHSAPDIDPAHGNPNGFDYTKISNSGAALPPSATLGTGANDWACTRDNVTGLIWEAKTTSGLRGQSHTYTWFNTHSPDGNSGTASGGTCETSGRCDTEKYTQDVNAAGLCGANDWRMPTVKELEGIADRGSSSPAIDPVFFPNTPSSVVWSGSPYAGSSNGAWVVLFDDGYAYSGYRYNGYHVRLVRAGQ